MRLADKSKANLPKIINYLNPFYLESRCDWGGLCYPALNTIKPMEPHDTGCKYAGERVMIGAGTLGLYKCKKYSQQKD